MARGGTDGPARRYKPGTRTAKFRDERFGDERYAWLRTYLGQYVILWRDKHDDESGVEAATPTVQFLITRPNSKPVTLNLTSLTREELDKTRQFFNMACDLAEPLVDIRDKVAQDAADQGDDSYVRSYRQVPELVVRSRTVGPDREVLRERPQDVPSRAEGDGGDNGGVRGHGDGVADRAPSQDSAEDNEQALD